MALFPPIAFRAGLLSSVRENAKESHLFEDFGFPILTRPIEMKAIESIWPLAPSHRITRSAFGVRAARAGNSPATQLLKDA